MSAGEPRPRSKSAATHSFTPGAGPLEGLTVLDLTRVLAGPYATQLLGDLGADVWKIERPGLGDETRTWGPPFVHGESAYFLSLNRNKKSATLDFTDAGDRATLLRAAAAADVVIENYMPGDLARHGLDAATLRAASPELVTCSITGFGQDGPYVHLPGYDAVLQGFTGLMCVNGEAGGAPLKVGVAVIDVLTGVHAATAILAALIGRWRGRGGATLDVPLFEVGVSSMANIAQAALVSGQPSRRHGNAHPQIVPYQTFEASDGPLVIAVGNDAQWHRLCAVLELPELAAEAALGTNPGRLEAREHVVSAVSRRVRERSRSHWLAKLAEARVPAGPVRDITEAVTDPALFARDMLRTATLQGGGTVPLLALPWQSDGVRPPLRLPPPALGQHTAEFRARFA